jgi:simple sugar transport system permease protein
MSGQLIVDILISVVVASTPLLLAGLGELIAERSGVLNLGLEGIMLMGAIAGFAAMSKTGSPALGALAALCVGASLGALHGLFTITLRADQIVAGLTLTIFGSGMSAYLGKPLVGVPAVATFTNAPVPLLANLPVLGPIFFQQNVLGYVAYLLVPALSFILYRTRFGLHIRAIGERPAVADSLGVGVVSFRYAAVIFGASLAGLAGAYLSLAYSPFWIENMTAGRGWVALGLVIFSGWDPFRLMVGALLFGTLDALGFNAQALGINIPSQFLRMLPYVLTVAALAIITVLARKRKGGVPASLGVAYDREAG